MAERPSDADGWYEAEEPFGRAVVLELRRLARRARARPIITLALTVFLTGLVTLRVVRKPTNKIASVIIAVSEGSLASGRDPMPVEELRAHIAEQLFDRDRQDALIEKLDLFPLRHKLGAPYARSELDDMVEITVYRNFFLAETYDPDVRRNARVEITATHSDGELAFAVAKGIADSIIDASEEQQHAHADELRASATAVLDQARADAQALDREVGEKRIELAKAQDRGDPGQLAATGAELRMLEQEAHDAQQKLAIIETGALSDERTAEAMAAGLDMKFEIVAERRPPPDVGRQLKLAILAIVVFVVMIPVAIIAVGAFDLRVHDTGDVSRLGYASLGHLPPYRGDRIGSLRARGVRRPRAAEY